MGKYSLLLRVRNFPFSSSLKHYLSTAINSLRLHLLEFQDMIKVLDPGHPKIAELKVTIAFLLSLLAASGNFLALQRQTCYSKLN